MFVMIDDDTWIKEECITKVICDNKQWQVILNDASAHKTDKIYADMILGRSVVKQLMPVTKETWGRYCLNYDKSYEEQDWYRDRVDAFAVCGDGSIRPVNYMEYFNGIDQFMDEDALFELDGEDYTSKI